MKTPYRIFGVLILLVICLSSSAIPALAEAPDAIEDFFLPSSPVGKPSVDVERMLAINLPADGIYTRESFGECTVDASNRIFEYSVGKGFWGRVSELSYEGIVEQILAEKADRHPTIYVPIFAEVADTKGNIHLREVGDFHFVYSSYRQSYGCYDGLVNLIDDFRDMKRVNSHERLVTYIRENGIVAKQVILLEEWGPNDLNYSIAVVETAEDTVLLNYSNSLHSDSWDWDNPKIEEYSISEYSALRKQLEPTWPVKAPVLSFMLSLVVSATFWVIEKLLYCLIILLIGAAIFFIIRRCRHRSAK